jgi:hypothetical protein
MFAEVMPEALTHQFAFLFLLALPVACVSWTVTHEEVFREPREYCRDKSQNCKPLVVRKFFYLFTCEYCFSHYVGWRGYLVSWFALVWVANIYMSAFNRLRLEIKYTNVEIAKDEVVKEKVSSQIVSELRLR